MLSKNYVIIYIYWSFVNCYIYSQIALLLDFLNSLFLYFLLKKLNISIYVIKSNKT